MTLAFRHQLFAAGFRAISLTRADLWARRLARGRGVVLMFHHVRPWQARAFAPNRLLEITPDFLDIVLKTIRNNGFDLITLDELPSRLHVKGRNPFAVLTFDDGYRDNIEYAAPILRRHGAPWTLFVTTEFAEGRGRLWWLELEEAIARLDQVSLSVGDEVVERPCGTPAEKRAAYEAIYWRLRAGPEHVLRERIGALGNVAGVKPEGLVKTLCVGWDELLTLAKDPAVTIGAHTVSHLMLAKHGEADARREIAQSKGILEQKLGRAVKHLAYPVGDAGSAGPREFGMAGEAGFATAVTTRPGHVFAGHADHLHALPRISVNGLFQSEPALTGMLSGVPFLVFNRGRKLNVS